MYAPPGFDSDSSGEETTPPTPAPPPPPKTQFKFRSLFTSTKKLEARAPRRAEGLKKDEEKESPGPNEKTSEDICWRITGFLAEGEQGRRSDDHNGRKDRTGTPVS